MSTEGLRDITANAKCCSLMLVIRQYWRLTEAERLCQCHSLCQ